MTRLPTNYTNTMLFVSVCVCACVIAKHEHTSKNRASFVSINGEIRAKCFFFLFPFYTTINKRGILQYKSFNNAEQSNDDNVQRLAIVFEDALRNTK